MRRHNYDFPDGRLRHQKNGWARVRDENGKVTVSYKQLNERTLHGTKEICITVDSFNNARALLEALGLQSNAYQETRRESWRLGNIEIELDHWPWSRPYVEVEAPDEPTIREIFTKLGLDYAKAVFGSVEVVYQAEYDVTDDDIWEVQRITFDDPVPANFKRKDA
jgi:adenylate cyclase, class 2